MESITPDPPVVDLSPNQQLEWQLNYLKHRRALRNVVPSPKVAPFYNHRIYTQRNLHNDKSRSFHENERQLEIDRKNKILADKLIAIKNSRPATLPPIRRYKKDPLSGTVTHNNYPLNNTLNEPGRRQAADRIYAENEKLVEQIVNVKSNLDIPALERSFKEHQRLLGMISKFKKRPLPTTLDPVAAPKYKNSTIASRTQNSHAAGNAAQAVRAKRNQEENQDQEESEEVEEQEEQETEEDDEGGERAGGKKKSIESTSTKASNKIGREKTSNQVVAPEAEKTDDLEADERIDTVADTSGPEASPPVEADVKGGEEGASGAAENTSEKEEPNNDNTEEALELPEAEPDSKYDTTNSSDDIIATLENVVATENEQSNASEADKSKGIADEEPPVAGATSVSETQAVTQSAYGTDQPAEDAPAGNEELTSALQNDMDGQESVREVVADVMETPSEQDATDATPQAYEAPSSEVAQTSNTAGGETEEAEPMADETEVVAEETEVVAEETEVVAEETE
eukprot:Platyproteum_vivax@DN3337_c0_g1_i2.p1